MKYKWRTQEAISCLETVRQTKACKDLQQCDLPLDIVQERIDPDKELCAQPLHD